MKDMNEPLNDEQMISLGLDPNKEMAIETPAGQYLVFPSAESEIDGVSYVRFVDKEGVEQLYYDADEWSESREQGMEVMGAILGFMVSGANLTDLSNDLETNMNIITTEKGDRVDLDQKIGDKEGAVAVFRSSNGYYIQCDIDELVAGGTPIEYEGDKEGEDMEYIGIGFLAN